MRASVIFRSHHILNCMKTKENAILCSTRSSFATLVQKSAFADFHIKPQPIFSSLLTLSPTLERKDSYSIQFKMPTVKSVWERYSEEHHNHSFNGTWTYNAHYSRRATGSTKVKVQVKEKEEEEQMTNQSYELQQQQQQQQNEQAPEGHDSNIRQHEALTTSSIQHMRKVYSTMFAASAIATSGSLLGMATGLVFISPLFTGILSFLPLIALERTDVNSSPSLRMALATSFAFLSGLSVAPLINYAMYMNPMAIPTALVVTTAIFGGMTFASLWAKKGSFLKLGPPLFGALIGTLLLGVATIFLPASSALYPILTSVYSYLGVGLFSLFIAYDNQRILHEYEAGERDHLKHGLSMFINLKNLFLHLLTIFSINRD